MAKKKTARQVFDNLYQRAMSEACFRRSEQRVKKALKSNDRWPEDLRPGYLVERLAEEDRMALCGLTSDMINDRVIYI